MAVRLVAFPTIIFPVTRLDAGITPRRQQGCGNLVRQKIDNSIVNNIEGSYHPQKSAVSSIFETRGMQTATTAAHREEWHEGSGQEFRWQGC
jgi:hypothetical protein